MARVAAEGAILIAGKTILFEAEEGGGIGRYGGGRGGVGGWSSSI